MMRLVYSSCHSSLPQQSARYCDRYAGEGCGAADLQNILYQDVTLFTSLHRPTSHVPTR